MSMDALTTVSKAHAELAVEAFELTSRPVVIPNFVDLADWQPSAPSERSSNRGVRLVHLSNFRPIKSVLDVERIFHVISQAMPVELWLLTPRARA